MRRGTEKSNPLVLVGCPGNQSHLKVTYGLSKSHLIYINSGVVERDFF